MPGPGDEMRVTVEQEIQNVRAVRPHLVILGAGASRQAFPEGEISGIRLPLMDNFVDCLGLDRILARTGSPAGDGNFERLFASLQSDPENRLICEEIEGAVYNYFDRMELPDSPTLYDHLIMSLRPKDVMATFNWDPLLIQAARRNPVPRGGLPRLLFLHGNVLAGYCESCSVHGVKGARCSRCESLFKPSRLLYPVATKDYETDPMIRGAWEQFDHALMNALVVTIFGYSAPVVDRAAADRMRMAWGGGNRRQFEEIEIIDLKPEEVLRETWDDFINTHHYSTTDSFYDSWIANHPRRTVEAFWEQTFEARFIESHPLPRGANLPEIRQWFRALMNVEDEAATT